VDILGNFLFKICFRELPQPLAFARWTLTVKLGR